MRLSRETRRRVVQMLKLCRLYEQIGFHPGYEPRITTVWSLAKSGKTNVVHSSTEQTAVRNVDTEAERRALVEKVHRALASLTKTEREVIRLCYWEDMSTVAICERLFISERTQKRVKTRALAKMALVLGLLTPEEEKALLAEL